jgi:hypothetical protein
MGRAGPSRTIGANAAFCVALRRDAGPAGRRFDSPRAFGALAMNPARSACRSIPQRPAAVLRSTPSNTRAIADIPRAAVASFAFAATARSWCAESSVRVIETAISPSMVP